eukprot:CAMPEP_0119021520 /NCGR_PEP_ID=MMETSP1176-20130426/26147_1 /TAXON_ID=265551 /ORGANISM="Synedropsis recta cf, Strain CCMP1620" /LENGTH=310 /DNA_ID=CAMNT_0006976143 /DNA_START=111 /DNA_END=1043 /DNA_ORIENTATION=+
MRRDNCSMESLEDRVESPMKSNIECNIVEHLSPSSVAEPREQSCKFFVMDWLEQLDECAMQQACGLKTPIKTVRVTQQQPFPGIRLDSVFDKPPPRHPDSSPISNNVVAANLSPFIRKSEAIGNGWNAKGLQKAKKGHWGDAILCWENALEVRQQVLGDSHPDVANTLNNMGIALGRLERFPEALESLNRALQIRTMIYGKVHLEIAATLHNIANFFQQMKDYNAALRCFEEAKRTQETLLGEDDVLVARTANAIGHLNYECSHFEMAREAYTEACAVFERAGYGEGDDEYDNVLLDIKDANEAAPNTHC